MPALSPTMKTGNIGKWLKNEGDKLAPGDLICEVETDKSTLEFEFAEEGYLAKILKPSGSKEVALGGPIAILVDDASKIASVQGLTLADLEGGVSTSEPATTSAPSTPQPTQTSAPATPSAKPKGLHEIAMPMLSPTMTKGRIDSWVKQVGDKITPGDIICTVGTDKATVDFEFQEEGYLAKIIVPQGSETALGEVIALLVENKEDIPAAAAYNPQAAQAAPATSAPQQAQPTQPTQQATSTPSTPVTTNNTGRVFASPLAKKIAEEKGVDLKQIGVGTGESNRIIKADVEEFIASGAARKAVATEAPPKVTTTAAQQAISTTPAVSGGAYVDIPVSQVRKIIADRLLESKRTIPHYYLTVEIEVDKLMKAREELNKAGEKRGFKLSVNDFLIKAAALSMKKVPEVNSSWQDTFIRQFNNVDLSVAVQTDTGLITPIVFSAETKGLAQISNEVKSLAARARENKLKPQEFQGGTFTISNLGMFGIDEFSAIINPPQSCILAVGKSQKKVIVNEQSTSAEDKFKVVTTMKVTLSCDHRVVDGAVGAQWLQEFKTLLENPLFMTL